MENKFSMEVLDTLAAPAQLVCILGPTLKKVKGPGHCSEPSIEGPNFYREVKFFS